MGRIVLVISFVLLTSGTFSQDTFSICAIDPNTGEVGSAGASCIGAPQIPQGCSILSDVIPGVGVIHTQAYYTPSNQSYAHQLMMLGLPPEQIIDSLVLHDSGNNPTIRQYGIAGQYGDTILTAAYTGVNCDDYKNHIIGPYYTIQGNILLGQAILDSMESRFLSTDGPLACRLMAALQGAKVPGADTRCLDDSLSSLSAFLRVALPDDPASNLYLDLNVPSALPGIDPIDSLQSLVDLWGGCLGTAVSSIPFGTPAQPVVINNPDGSLRIILPFATKTASKATVFDRLGREVQKFNFDPGNSFVINYNFKPGFYILLLKSDEVRWKPVKFVTH
ncbi:MAG: hypothetical protein Kow00127_10730 [Bacteroidales bacterium]